MSEFLPGLPTELIRAAYAAAPGNELASGKFDSPESSSALVANSFGFFLDRPADLPPIPAIEAGHWPPSTLQLEAIVRFPWSGGRHPCLDVLIHAGTQIIGIESKRYEPLRSKGAVILSEAYWRPVWGEKMAGYQNVRDQLRAGTLKFRHLDPVQLIKHAFGLRTAATRKTLNAHLVPTLIYLHAEPSQWPDGKPVKSGEHEKHRQEIDQFAAMVAGDDVKFSATTYKQTLDQWDLSPAQDIRAHAQAVRTRYDI